MVEIGDITARIKAESAAEQAALAPLHWHCWHSIKEHPFRWKCHCGLKAHKVLLDYYVEGRRLGRSSGPTALTDMAPL